MGSARRAKGERAGEAASTRQRPTAMGTWVGHLVKKILGHGHHKQPQADEEGNGFVLDSWGRPVPISPRGNLPCLFFYSECRRDSGHVFDVPSFNPAIHGHPYPQHTSKMI
ncbi:UNVERIFIED_CONTAM: hypothetical protein HHA_264630 [Hammondia hammondi]|eukprot:XP_008887260.1 hypothetical protein HHA_264630 [Hammondia hammondi]